MQVFRYLQGEHSYCQCYGQLERYVRRHGHGQPDTFIPLGHFLGERLDANFCHMYIDFSNR
jgi:hypothetical protein